MLWFILWPFCSLMNSWSVRYPLLFFRRSFQVDQYLECMCSHHVIRKPPPWVLLSTSAYRTCRVSLSGPIREIKCMLHLCKFALILNRLGNFPWQLLSIHILDLGSKISVLPSLLGLTFIMHCWLLLCTSTECYSFFFCLLLPWYHWPFAWQCLRSTFSLFYIFGTQ